MISFYEYIRPKLEYTLNKLNVTQDLSNANKLDFIDLKLNFEQDRFPDNAITYTCLFCNVSYSGFDGKTGMTMHIKEKHRLESEIVCCKCGQKFNFCALVGSRYRHNCEANKI